jgi:transposase-like protein
MKRAYQNGIGKSRECWEKVKVETDNGTTVLELPVSLAEVMGATQEALTDLVYRVGLVLIRATLNEEVKSLVGARYHPVKSSPWRRWAKQPGYVIWAGKKVPLKRPRVRSLDGKREARLTSYQSFQSQKGLDERLAERVILGLSSRDYQRAIDDFVEGYGLKKSSISRHFIKVSRGKLEDLMERPLDTMDLAVIGIDGIEIAGECLIIAVGIDVKGKKHILGLWQGATENAEVCKSLIADMVRRGLDMAKKYLFVVDGAKALNKAIKETFGADGLIQRCQIHKRRNVKGHLPEGYQAIVDNRLKVAYNMKDYSEAKDLLLKTVEYLDEINPSAARSLEEGLEETLTVHRLMLPDILRKTLSNTNFIESPLALTRDVIRDVKRWRRGDQRLRWVASALLEAEKRMILIRGCRALPILINNLKNIDRVKDIA